jgi:hypothetical protein
MSSNEKPIRIVMILEILGKPKEYLSESLNNIINQIKNEPGISVKNSKTNEPKELRENKEVFSSFAEIELESKDIHSFVVLMFKYMPSHVEILSPLKYEMTNNELGDILTDLILRLHSYENVARIMQSEKNILERRLKELLVKTMDKENEKSNKIVINPTSPNVENKEKSKEIQDKKTKKKSKK